MEAMDILFRYFSKHLVQLVEEQSAPLWQPVTRKIRRITFGVLLVLLSLFIWWLVAIAVLAAIFFALSPYHQLLAPALWTAAGGTTLGLLILLIAERLIQPK